MDFSSIDERSNVRLSNSPASAPVIVDEPTSPVRSVHLDMEESIRKQPDRGMRTADFFDDTSSDDEADGASTRAHAGEAPTPMIGSSSGKRRVASPPKAAYLGGGATPSEYVSQCDKDQRGTPYATPTNARRPELGFLKLTTTPGINIVPDSSFPPPPPKSGDGTQASILRRLECIDSLEDTRNLQRAGHSDTSNGNSFEEAQAQLRPLNVCASGPGRLITTPQSRLSAAIAEDMRPASKLSKEEQILGAHAITLQALLGDKEGLQASTQRQSHEFTAATAAAGDTNFRLRAVSAPGPNKRVDFIPPPIDVSSKGHLPEQIVRTPYPFSFRRSQPPRSPLANSMSPGQPQDSTLVLSIRRHPHQTHAARKVTQLNIPADLNIAPAKMKVASPRTKEKHFDTLDFDDAHFFRQLNKSYAKLAGPLRFLSARHLKRIDVSHSTYPDPLSIPSFPHSPDTPLYCCPAPLPRSPRFLASQGLTDSFSTAELMKLYRRPGLGKAKYGWVHWAHRLASAAGTGPLLQSPAPNPPADSPEARGQLHGERDVEQEVCAAGLEFVEGWCVWRIVVALTVVFVLALAAALLWVFLGLSVLPVGYRGAGSRIGEGAAFGVFVLLLGWAIVGGWVWVSWLE